MPIYRLYPHLHVFPPPEHSEPGGLLAIGGDLSCERLLEAYRHGIFPWYSADQPILWWSPDPRLILEPSELKISRSLRKVLKKQKFSIRTDTHFAGVIRACAAVRENEGEGTWITSEMEAAYLNLHHQGYAHSVESWHAGQLVGGLYGVFLGRCFFGESMFSLESDASKVAFVALVEQMRLWEVDFIDCQVTTRHLMSLGAKNLARPEFLLRLKQGLEAPTLRGAWDWANTEARPSARCWSLLQADEAEEQTEVPTCSVSAPEALDSGTQNGKESLS